jgi:hypothetical protein
MPLLSEPQCPNCLSTLSLRPLWTVTPNLDIPLRGRVGIVCPTCGANLEVRQTLIYLGIVPFLAAIFGGIILISLLLQHQGQANLGVQYAAALVWFAITYWLFRYYAPRLARLRVAPDDHELRFPLELAKMDAAQYSEYLQEIDNAQGGLYDDGSKREWTCPHCREKVPGNFEVCWKCTRPRS